MNICFRQNYNTDTVGQFLDRLYEEKIKNHLSNSQLYSSNLYMFWSFQIMFELKNSWSYGNLNFMNDGFSRLLEEQFFFCIYKAT